MIFLAYPGLNGQTSFLSTSINSGSPLTSAEDSILTKIQNSQVYSDIYFVNLQSLALSQVDGRITINLPGNTCGDITYYAKTVEYESENDYFWYGTIELPEGDEEEDCSEGDFIITSTIHGKRGQVTIDDNSFELISLSKTTYILGKIDNDNYDCSYRYLKSSMSTQLENSPVETRNNEVCNVVKYLVLYTQRAINYEGSTGNILLNAESSINLTNEILNNSDVKENELKIELVAVQPLEGFSETSDIDADLDSLINNEQANILRDSFNADIVVLFVNRTYIEDGYLYYGAAYRGPNIDSAFAIVHVQTSTSKHTFPHEIGHLFGANHEPAETTNYTGFAHGYSFKTGFLFFTKTHVTTMHSIKGNQIKHYSNPDVKYKRKKTGVKDNNDNARQIRNTACTVAQFRQPKETFYVRIVGDKYVCPCRLAYFEAVFTNGPSGEFYNYQWYSSLDGINWTTLYNTTPYLSINASCTEGKRLFIKVEVSSSGGKFGSDITSIEAASEWPRQDAPCPLFLKENTKLVKENDILSVSPNPTIGASTISFTVKDSNLYTINIYDINGRFVKSIINKDYLQAGNHQFRVEMKREGVYFIISSDNNGNLNTIKLLIL